MSVSESRPLAGIRDWRCACGQEYRVAAVRGELRFWPRNSNDGYCRHGLPQHATCVRCNALLLPPRNPAL